MKIKTELNRNINLKNHNLHYNLTRKRVNSNASRNIHLYKFKLPLNLKYKKLLYKKKNNGGRIAGSKRLIFSKGQKNYKYSIPKINYSFRNTHITFLAGLIFIPFLNKVISLVFLASGTVTYLATTNQHTIFSFNTFKKLMYSFSKEARQFLMTGGNFQIKQSYKIIRQLPKNKFICLLEQFPLDGIKYIRSSGSKGKILKMDTRTQISIVELPSKIHKTTSIYSIASLGYVYFAENKKYKNTKSGYYRNQGIKSRVRGVAKNPVDHPHGGRTKSIRLPRTPWGKVAKLK